MPLVTARALIWATRAVTTSNDKTAQPTTRLTLAVTLHPNKNATRTFRTPLRQRADFRPHREKVSARAFQYGFDKTEGEARVPLVCAGRGFGFRLRPPRIGSSKWPPDHGVTE